MGLNDKAPLTSTPARYCKSCGYSRQSLTTPRCPECSRPFDPANPRTTAKRPPRRWTKYALRAALALLTVALLLAAAWGRLYWGWYDEQKALADLKPDAVSVEPRLPHWLDKADYSIAKWLRNRATSISFVLDRADEIDPSSDNPDIVPLARLQRLRELHLVNINGLTDLSPLAGLSDLEILQLSGDKVTDLSPLRSLNHLVILRIANEPGATDFSVLSKLSRLQELHLHHTSIRDLSPLAGLTSLESLDLSWTKISTLAPLAGMTELVELDLSGCSSLRDLTPLFKLKSLLILDVDYDFPQDLTDALQRARPDCTIQRR